MTELIYSLVWIAGITFGVFASIEGLISKDLKRRLSDFVTRNPSALDDLPSLAGQLFIRIFGSSHFSLRCVAASVIASCSFLTLMYVLRLILVLWTHANNSSGEIYQYLMAELKYPFMSEVGGSVVVSLVANLVLDFFGLLKTRLIITFLAKRGGSVWLGCIAAFADLVFSFAIFQAFYLVFYFVGFIVSFTTGHMLLPAGDANSFLPMIALMVLFNFATSHAYPDGTAMHFLAHSHVVFVILAATFFPLFLTSVFFYASIAPSIWLWLFVGASTVSRLVAPFWPSALYALNFEDAPLKMIGLMAAALMVLLWTFTLLLLALGLQILSALLN